MNAKEFMIGDWVRDAGRTDRPVYKRINRVDERENDCVADEYKVILGEAGMEPIPITPEILEANGFEKDPEDGTMCWVNGEEEEVNWRGTILCISSISALMEHDSCMYVHQLQHALRLCGLYDLADNFKMTKGN